jgi:hypothetical protein
MMRMSLEQEIKDQALALGFDAVGITDTAPIGAEHVEHFERWLRSGCAGRMEYMHRNLEKRLHPAHLRKGAKSVIVVALNYRPTPAQDAGCAMSTGTGRVALRPGEDYHVFIKALCGTGGFHCIRTPAESVPDLWIPRQPEALASGGLDSLEEPLLIHRNSAQILLGDC